MNMGLLKMTDVFFVANWGMVVLLIKEENKSILDIHHIIVLPAQTLHGFPVHSE